MLGVPEASGSREYTFVDITNFQVIHAYDARVRVAGHIEGQNVRSGRMEAARTRQPRRPPALPPTPVDSLPQAQKATVPASWEFASNKKGVKRYTCPELRELVSS